MFLTPPFPPGRGDGSHLSHHLPQPEEPRRVQDLRVPGRLPAQQGRLLLFGLLSVNASKPLDRLAMSKKVAVSAYAPGGSGSNYKTVSSVCQGCVWIEERESDVMAHSALYSTGWHE